MEFLFTADRFSGPYISLLSMIEERKLSITEVTLGTLADEYIAYVKSLDVKDYGDISQFVVVAATLMLIKVKSLLPGVSYTETEEKQIHELESKLKLHESLRTGMRHVSASFMKESLYTKPRTKITEPIFTPAPSLSVETLYSIAILMRAAFERVERVKKHVVSQVIRLEDVIESLRIRITQATSATFSSLVAETSGSYEEKKKMLIVNFLAILELVKVGSLEAEQEEGGITLTSLPV